MTVQPGDEYKELQLGNTYGLDRAKLPPPDLILHPRTGDLIIFDATRVHAVTKQQVGTRITCSAFIGYRGKEVPLVVYS
jgi:predicted 2-oxoglutarate/Fe(II)-dependent dioxygenase YbiX